MVSINVNKDMRMRWRLSRKMRRGKRVTQRRLAQAIPSNGPLRPRSLAEVGAMVETVMVEETDGPSACGLSLVGEKEQFSPAVKPLQERLMVP